MPINFLPAVGGFVLGVVVDRLINEGIDIILEPQENEPRTSPQPETPRPQPAPPRQPRPRPDDPEVIRTLTGRLQQRGVRLVQQNSILRDLAQELENLGEAAINDPFNPRAQRVRQQFEQTLQTELEPLLQQEAGNLGVQIRPSLSSIFNRA